MFLWNTRQRLWSQENSLSLFPLFPYLFEVMGPETMTLIFWMLSFKPAFSLYSFTFIRRPFSYSLFSSMRVVSSAYLRVLIFLLIVVIPPCASFILAFHMMYSSYKLNKQDDNKHPWSTPFPIWNQSIVPCVILTIASLPAYRFLRRKIRWSHISFFLILFHSLLWSTQSRAFNMVNEAEVVFYWNSLAVSMIQ